MFERSQSVAWFAGWGNWVLEGAALSPRTQYWKRSLSWSSVVALPPRELGKTMRPLPPDALSWELNWVIWSSLECKRKYTAYKIQGIDKFNSCNKKLESKNQNISFSFTKTIDPRTPRSPEH